MTTIAWDGRYVAADSLQGTSEYNCGEPATKLKTVGSCVYGVTGYFAWFDAWVKWHQDGADPRNLPVCTAKSANSTLIVFTGGCCFTFDQELPYADYSFAPYAFGSGAKYAIGAMEFGASAKEAVEVCCRIDPHSGGPVQVIDLQAIQKELAA